MECKDVSIDKAEHLVGPKIPHKDIHEHLFYPELFRTSETVPGLQKGFGWEPNAISPWFTFYNKGFKSFMARSEKDGLTTFKRKVDEPGPGEKW